VEELVEDLTQKEKKFDRQMRKTVKKNLTSFFVVAKIIVTGGVLVGLVAFAFGLIEIQIGRRSIWKRTHSIWFQQIILNFTQVLPLTYIFHRVPAHTIQKEHEIDPATVSDWAKMLPATRNTLHPSLHSDQSLA